MSKYKSILQDIQIQHRVSSVLNNDMPLCGKANMFDGQDETCWCSENGSPQWVALNFKTPKLFKMFQIQFQGGFVGQDCEIVMVKEGNEKILDNFYPEDNNTLQTFYVKEPIVTKQVTLKFNSSTDFFGRIVIYNMDFCTDE